MRASLALFALLASAAALAQPRKILGTLDNPETDKENADSYRQSLADDHDAATVALVQSRRAAFESGPRREKAEKQAQQERRQAAVGRAPSRAELQGKWKFDVEAPLAHMSEGMGLPQESLAQVRQTLVDSIGETTYTFSGDTLEQRTVKPGKPAEVNRSTYRLAGNDLVVRIGKRESTMQVGMKSANELIFSMMGAGSVYRRE